MWVIWWMVSGLASWSVYKRPFIWRLYLSCYGNACRNMCHKWKLWKLSCGGRKRFSLSLWLLLFRLGVVKDTSFVEIMQCDKERRFLKDGAEHPAECNSCRWRRMCFGGCKRDWYVDSTGNHNYLCGAFQMFFEHSFPRIEQIAKQQKACLYWAFLDFLERPCIYWSCVIYYTKLKIGKRIIVQWYINGGARHDRRDLCPLFIG